MKNKIPLITRLLLGFVFFAAGVAGLLNLAPPPAELPANLRAFMDGMLAAHYFFPLVKGTETVCGLLLLTGQFVPLALVVLAPIIVNIFLVHAFMAPAGLVTALVVGVLEIYLAFFSPYKASILPLFRRK